jgi:hypothetical protein
VAGVVASETREIWKGKSSWNSGHGLVERTEMKISAAAPASVEFLSLTLKDFLSIQYRYRDR